MPDGYDPRTEEAGALPWLRTVAGSAVVLTVAVFAACLFGIWTRPVGFLASVWPANAIMLGLLLRIPSSATVFGWGGASAAFMAADLLTGATLFKAAILNTANLAGIGTAYLIYMRLSPEMTRLRQPMAMLHLVIASAAAGCMAGVVGGIANPILFNGSVTAGWTFWFATEFVNYIAILPVILSMPSLRTLDPGNIRRLFSLKILSLLPAGALALSCAVALIVGGPGSIAFPVPALLWCGLAYSIFPTALLTLAFGVWALVLISNGYLPNPAEGYDETALISVRLGASLIALAPIMLASVMQSRNDLLARLNHLANHDPLTGAATRNAFRESVQRLIADRPDPFVLLMFDIDHFKAVNDTYGHGGGDEVLAAFARRVSNCLRPGDVFGRLGGEEFATLVFGCSHSDGVTLAERIRLEVCGEPIALADGRLASITVSIGLLSVCASGIASIDRLFANVDAALYAAKGNGRNRVEIAAGGDAKALVA
ncbi:MAG: diguanylate cyclase [Rhizobiaceae bacterium]